MIPKFFVLATFAIAILGAEAKATPLDYSQNIAIDSDVKIPGFVLKPGIYTFAVQDRTKDRWMVSISGAKTDRHYLLLAIAARKAGEEDSKGIVLFTSGDSRNQTLRGWFCPNCAQGLEFVYPKQDAMKIAESTGHSVLAVDSAYDKLPSELSVTDMKAATLWLVRQRHLSSRRSGAGVRVVRYANGERQGNQASSNVNAAGLKLLPKTATDTFTLAVCGLGLWAFALFVRVNRVRRPFVS